MVGQYSFDVFLSYSSKDSEVVHLLGNRPKERGLRVWLDMWEIKAGDSTPAKVEEGLEQSFGDQRVSRTVRVHR